jgi:broad specificity phosphatase PhoE
MRERLTRAILIRHTDPVDEARARCYGTTDVGLSPRGERRARHLAGMLRRMPIDAVYTSPSRRAVDTARPLAAPHDLTPVELDDLRELDFGACEGRTYDEIAAEEPEFFRTWMLTPTEVRFPGGESYAQLRRRALAASAELRRRHPAGTFAVVSHGGVVRAILADALAMPDEAIFRLDVRYGGVSMIEWSGTTPIVRLVNAPPVAVGSRRRGFFPTPDPALG